MTTDQWKMVHLYQCPCGYAYEPEKGDPQQGWPAGMSYDELPEYGTCPLCQRAKVNFREKKYSTRVKK